MVNIWLIYSYKMLCYLLVITKYYYNVPNICDYLLRVIKIHELEIQKFILFAMDI